MLLQRKWRARLRAAKLRRKREERQLRRQLPTYGELESEREALLKKLAHIRQVCEGLGHKVFGRALCIVCDRRALR